MCKISLCLDVFGVFLVVFMSKRQWNYNFVLQNDTDFDFPDLENLICDISEEILSLYDNCYDYETYIETAHSNNSALQEFINNLSKCLYNYNSDSFYLMNEKYDLKKNLKKKLNLAKLQS